ncbi:unnamed protein product [Schistosoma mattheei]|uniref:Uncharacterized protein n=1 Tax=Schistosoma mattheei TaxID=31246 RepID=A0A3P8C303_9TREM|nr:unnamed protein product [Schistosoma mattheei]
MKLIPAFVKRPKMIVLLHQIPVVCRTVMEYLRVSR